MSHIRCVCGHRISDITDFLPYKAYFLPDQDIEEAMEKSIEEAAQFADEWERGEHAGWLREQLEPYLKEHGLGATIKFIAQHTFNHPTFKFGRPMYECEECGRLWLQKEPVTSMGKYDMPESPARGILRHEGATQEE